MRIYVKGYGCSSSFADAEVLAGCLSSAGYSIVGDVHNAELVVCNTCAVKGPTENRMIGLLKKISEEKKLVVAGCLPLVNFERLCREVQFDGVVGPASGKRIVDVVEKVSSGMHVVSLDDAEANMPPLDLPHIHLNPRVAIIPISYGCLGSCAYCCVRFARGRLRSYSVKEIVNKVESEVADNVHEFWLTSQDTACYGKDIGTDLVELLRGVCSVEGGFFVRVGMMTPNHSSGFFDGLLEAFQDEKVFKFLHMPIQSGDDAVLERMNRFHSAEDFTALVRRFREAFQQSTFATDVIVGFPGETEEAFMRTWEFVEEVRPDIVNVSKFFARPGTVAAELRPRVSPLEVKQRSARLSRLVRRVALLRNRSWNGWRGRILVDELGKPGSVVGRNFAYKPVVVRDGDGQSLLGEFVSVKVVDAFQSYLLGEVLWNSC